ncbi:Primosomal protein N' [BD1-7 clade bacterium]|uniref:Replication restart protein PriA n=1 Tax=BD1-7 clade bacterium TaxID=2029982 RepID=A0A5S9MY52_9GAMM|nr:Primosomal protein N' [BD1-7 clade bacterium]
MPHDLFLKIAVNCPLRRSFDYLPPKQVNELPVPGTRVSVPFGNRKLTGIVIATTATSDLPANKLRHVETVLDSTPIVSTTMMQLATWMSDYYQHPIGECFAILLPSLLRKGEKQVDLSENGWQLTDSGKDFRPAANAIQQQKAIDYFQSNARLNDDNKGAAGISLSALKNLVKKDVLHPYTEQPAKMEFTAAHIHHSPFGLNTQQAGLIQRFEAQPPSFRPILLEGITGSGKTEVYLQLIERVLLAGKQALILVPEIGLTPQTIARFQKRFDCAMAVFHSNLTDQQRLRYWQQSQAGIARIIIGTRSALFTATEDLGIIIIDEEHDLSYKQQDGLRYSARDLACVRAKIEQIPVVLGSATPSLETLNNADTQKFEHWELTERAGNASPATVELVDIRNQPMVDGLAESVLPHIAHCLQQQQQALVFINRRGFAPMLICHDCGWVSQCEACDARMTLHLRAQHLRCHHCQAVSPIPMQCPACQSSELVYQGAGTERLESTLKQHFPDAPLFRIDRDTTAGKQTMQNMLAQIHEQPSAILVGTQMLAKGHHFPNVTLVVILEADSALMGTDYRATERFGQLVTQIVGRAGREEKPGHALIQTHYPDHMQLQKLVHHGYRRLAMDLLSQRRELGLPPFSFQALIRLEARDAQDAINLLQHLQQSISHLPIIAIGPYPANLQRRAHYFRFQLMLQAHQRAQLKYAVGILLDTATALIKPAQHRFSVDIDPQDVS